MAKAKIKRLYLIPILSKALDVIELLEQDNAPLSAGGCLPEDQDLQDQRLSHSENAGASRLPGADAERAVPAGFAAAEIALWICGAERGDAVQRSCGAERGGGGGRIGRGTADAGQPLRSSGGGAAMPRSLWPSAWTWCWSSRWKRQRRRAWRTSSRRPRFRWWRSMCLTPMRPILAWTTSKWATRRRRFWRSMRSGNGRAK